MLIFPSLEGTPRTASDPIPFISSHTSTGFYQNPESSVNTNTHPINCYTNIFTSLIKKDAKCIKHYLKFKVMHISVKTVSAVSQNICKSFMVLPIST